MLQTTTFTPAQLAINYSLFFDYDRAITKTGTLQYFITMYGEDMVNKFLDNPTSIHWTCSFTVIN